MKILRPISILAAWLMMSASAVAQTPLLPPPGAPTPAAGGEGKAQGQTRGETKARRGGQETRARRHAEAGGNAGADRDGHPGPHLDDPNVDLVYGAYQRGQYKTAFDLATNRAQFNGDPKAMTMLGELYANAMGVKRDYAKAAEWYKRAADARRPRGHVRAGDAAPRRARRPGQPRGSREAAGVLGQARQPEGGL